MKKKIILIGSGGHALYCIDVIGATKNKCGFSFWTKNWTKSKLSDISWFK